MSDSNELIDLYLSFKESAAFTDLDEEALLSFLQLGRKIDYPGGSMILKEGSEIRYVYAFLKGGPIKLKRNGDRPVFWGIEALAAPTVNPSDLVAPPEGTRALVFSVSRLIAFLNEAPDVLISLIKQTTKT